MYPIFAPPGGVVVPHPFGEPTYTPLFAIVSLESLLPLDEQLF